MLRRITSKLAWHELQVGDIVLVREQDEIPADMVILASAEEGGRAFVETSNLDGETNLKRKQALRATSEVCGQKEGDSPMTDSWIHLARAARLEGEIEYEQPNDRLYTFVGTMRMASSHRAISQWDNCNPRPAALRGDDEPKKHIELPSSDNPKASFTPTPCEILSL